MGGPEVKYHQLRHPIKGSLQPHRQEKILKTKRKHDSTCFHSASRKSTTEKTGAMVSQFVVAKSKGKKRGLIDDNGSGSRNKKRKEKKGSYQVEH